MDAQFKRYRQIAIFVSSLDRNAADSLMEQLSSEEAAAIRRTILSLDDISPAEEAEALAEFMRRGGIPAEESTQRTALDTGVELDAELASRFQSAPDAVNVPAGKTSTPDTKPEFLCLKDIDGSWLAPLIRQEHPQTIAVVVSHLPQPEAARLLGALPDQQQTDIIRRLADLDEMDIDSLCLIERHLEERLSEHARHKQRRTTGVSNVAAILRAADPITRSRLVKQLRMSDHQLAEQLHHNASQASMIRPEVARGNQTEYSGKVHTDSHPRGVTESAESEEFEEPNNFEQLSNWTASSLKTLLRECQPELILLAMTGADDRIIRRVLEMFPAKQAATLRHALNHPGPTRLSDVEAAQQEIMSLAARLEQEGRLAPGTGRLSMAA